MQSYPVRASHRANLTLATIERLARTHFGSAAVEGGAVSASFGAIERLLVRPAGRELEVEVRSNPKVEDTVARSTIDRYNRFLEDVTGFSAKERARRLRKSAGASSSATAE